MDVTEYRMIAFQCGLYGTLWENMCKLFPDCKGCPFEDGVDKNVIAEAYGVDESNVMCQMCDWYDSDKRWCIGWEDNIKNENHHCVFYQPELTLPGI